MHGTVGTQDKVTYSDPGGSRAWQRSIPDWVGYVATILIVLALTAILDSLRLVFPGVLVLVPYILLTMGIAYYFGLGPAVLSVMLAMFGQSFVYVQPIHHFWPLGRTTGEWARLWFLVAGMVAAGWAMLSVRKLTTDLRRSNESLSMEIIERKRLATELEQQHAMLDDVLSATSDHIYMYDVEGRCLYINRAGAEALGRNQDDIIGKTWRDLQLSPEVTEPFEALLRELFESGQAARSETYFPTAHGLRYYHYTLSPLTTRDGLVYAVVATMSDITERRITEQSLEAERSRLKAVLDTLPVGVLIADENGRITDSNRAAIQIWGEETPLSESTEGYAKYKGWWAGTGEPIEPENWALARAISKGETSVGEVVDIERFDGRRATILNSAAPIRDSHGRIIGGVATMQDITEMEKLRKELEYALRDTQRDRHYISAIEGLSEAAISIPSIDQLLDIVAERVAKGMGTHSCTIFLLDEATDELVACAAYNTPESIGFRIPAHEGFVGRINAERRTIYLVDAEHDPLAETPSLKREGVKSLLGAPMIGRKGVVGVLYLDTQEVRNFDTEEVRLLELLAARAALVIENAQLQDEIARNFALLQRALLPPSPPQVPGCQIATTYIPGAVGMEIGGDFYDIFDTEDGKLAIVIGDVAGKGIPSASLAAATRSTVHAFTYDTSAPGDSLVHANSVIHSESADDMLFVTVFVGVIDRHTGQMYYASAGHPPPAVYHAASGTMEFLAYSDPPVAVLDSYEFKQSESHVDPGDKIVFYTDGLDEARHDGIMFGLEGIERVLMAHAHESPESVMEALVEAATEWSQGGLVDDTAIIVMECEGLLSIIHEERE